MNLAPEEQERSAYITGDVRSANLLADFLDVRDAENEAREEAEDLREKGEKLQDLVHRLLNCAELSQDNLEPDTEDLIDEARQALDY